MNIIQTNEPCFSIIESLIDSIVLTFWETKEDMDTFIIQKIKLAEFVEAATAYDKKIWG